MAIIIIKSDAAISYFTILVHCKISKYVNRLLGDYTQNVNLLTMAKGTDSNSSIVEMCLWGMYAVFPLCNIRIIIVDSGVKSVEYTYKHTKKKWQSTSTTVKTRE